MNTNPKRERGQRASHLLERLRFRLNEAPSGTIISAARLKHPSAYFISNKLKAMIAIPATRPKRLSWPLP